MQRFGATLLYWFMITLGLTSLVVAAAGFVKALNPSVLRLGSNTIVALGNAYWKLSIVFALFGVLAITVAVWLFLSRRKSKRRTSASHF